MQSPQLDHDHKILEACCGALIIQLDGDECSVKEVCMPMRPLDIKDATHILKTDESHGFPQQLAPFLTGEMHGAVKEDVWRIIHNFDIRNFTADNPHRAAIKKAIAALKDRVGIRDLAEEEVASMDELKISKPPAVLHQCTADFGLAYRTVPAPKAVGRAEHRREEASLVFACLRTSLFAKVGAAELGSRSCQTV